MAGWLYLDLSIPFTLTKNFRRMSSTNNNLGLSYNAKKALSVHIGESAANEIATLLQRMAVQIEELKRNKVSVTPVIPGPKQDISPLASLDNETF